MSGQENINRHWAANKTQSKSLLLCVLLAALFLLAGLTPPYTAAGLPFWNRLPEICLFHACTGLPCPGCGMTRSLVLCAHGLWCDAVQLHPLGPALFITGIIAMFQHGATAWQPYRESSHRVFHPQLLRFAAVAFLLVWVARLIGWLPSPP